MRGPRETVAKALALECMRAAKAQERGCYVFAFAGPQEVCHHPSSLPSDKAAACLLAACLSAICLSAACLSAACLCCVSPSLVLRAVT